MQTHLKITIMTLYNYCKAVGIYPSSIIIEILPDKGTFSDASAEGQTGIRIPAQTRTSMSYDLPVQRGTCVLSRASKADY